MDLYVHKYSSISMCVCVCGQKIEPYTHIYKLTSARISVSVKHNIFDFNDGFLANVQAYNFNCGGKAKTAGLRVNKQASKQMSTPFSNDGQTKKEKKRKTTTLSTTRYAMARRTHSIKHIAYTVIRSLTHSLSQSASQPV